MKITKQQARRFILAYQGLWPPYQLEGKSGILDYMHRVRCIQFDPLNIVGHNPELVLQARIADFKPAMLQELLYDDRDLLDGWDKMMSIYPTDDWQYFRRNRDAARLRFDNAERPATAILPQVREAIKQRGPLSSIDLDFNETVNWFWSPTRLSRAALESMYTWGELIVHHKVHTRKVYDFASRYIPPEILDAPEPNVTEEQYHDWYVLRRIGSIGILPDRAGDGWLGMAGIKSRERKAALERLLKKDKVIKLHIEGIKNTLYMRNQDTPLLHEILNGKETTAQAAIIAPLDNLMWDRRFVEELFSFYYRWEVYKPVEERQYGYYVLPILYGDRFVARFEPGHDKVNNALTIKQWWWEDDVVPSEPMLSAIKHCFKRFLNYLGKEHLQTDDSLDLGQIGTA